MDNFVKVYEEWLESRTWGAKIELSTSKRTALAVLDNAKKKAWNSLTEPQRAAIIRQLVSEDALPHSVLAAIDIFDAKVIGI